MERKIFNPEKYNAFFTTSPISGTKVAIVTPKKFSLGKEYAVEVSEYSDGLLKISDRGHLYILCQDTWTKSGPQQFRKAWDNTLIKIPNNVFAEDGAHRLIKPFVEDKEIDKALEKFFDNAKLIYNAISSMCVDEDNDISR